MGWRATIALPLLLIAAPEPPGELLQVVHAGRTTLRSRENGRVPSLVLPRVAHPLDSGALLE